MEVDSAPVQHQMTEEEVIDEILVSKYVCMSVCIYVCMLACVSVSPKHGNENGHRVNVVPDEQR
jgi:DNA/RNA endonuclease YhcR with UshA esterase domain